LMASDTVVWAGLDYSMVRMIGGSNFEYDFKVPDLIFPGMLEKWNQLFLDERVELVANALGKRVSVDIGGVTERNKAATPKQVILTAGPQDVIKESHITQQDIAAEVRSYKMEKTNGLGLVFVVDRLVNLSPAADRPGIATRSPRSSGAAVYVVFFDIATRKVISAKRELHFVSTGGNFRNFWFGPIKSTDKNLREYNTNPKKYR